MIHSLELELVAIAGAFIVLVVMPVAVHLMGRPPLAERYPVTFWVMDLIVIPLTILVGAELFSGTAVGMRLVEEGTALNNLAVGLLHLTGVWLVARGLELVVWRGFFAEHTGRSAPALLKGLTCTALFVAGLAMFLWNVDYPVTGFLVSTGLVAGILGLALQNTLSDLGSGIALSRSIPSRQTLARPCGRSSCSAA
jgi:small-conductance mechanosensitive channel